MRSQRKTFDTAVKVDGDRRIKFVISDDSVDRHNDTVAVNGWELTNYRKNPVVLWAHSRKDLPVARAISVGVEGNKLVATAEFAEFEFARTVFELYRDGFLKATSVGFKPLAWTKNEVRGGIDFTRQELVEFSAVPVPANPNALVAAGKAGIGTKQIQDWARCVLADNPDANSRASRIADAFVEGVQRHLVRQRERSEVVLQLEPTYAVDERELKAATALVLRDAVTEAVKVETGRALDYLRGKIQ